MSWSSITLKNEYISIYKRINNRIKTPVPLPVLRKMIKSMGEADFLDDFADLNNMAFHLSGVEDDYIGVREQDVFNRFQLELTYKGRPIGFINIQFQNLHKSGFEIYKKKFMDTYKNEGYHFPDKWTSAGETHLIAAKTWKSPKSKKKMKKKLK